MLVQVQAIVAAGHEQALSTRLEEPAATLGVEDGDTGRRYRAGPEFWLRVLGQAGQVRTQATGPGAGGGGTVWPARFELRPWAPRLT